MCFSVLPTIYTSQTQETAPTYHLSLYYRSLPSLLLIANAETQAARATSFTNSEVVIEVVCVPLGRIARRLAHLPAALDEGHGGLLLGLLCLARLLSCDAHPAAVYALDVEPPVAYLSTQEARF